MSDDDKHDAEDLALFRSEMESVRPLRNERVEPEVPKPRPVPIQSQHDERRVLDDMFSDATDWAEHEAGEELLFSRPGLQQRVIQQLRRGQIARQAELDLHGLNREQARHALTEFLHRCRLEHVRCVRIIHGKGHGSLHRLPVLKNKVAHWLAQRSEILAFCSARPNDGGTGAVYVLLKKSR